MDLVVSDFGGDSVLYWVPFRLFCVITPGYADVPGNNYSCRNEIKIKEVIVDTQGNAKITSHTVYSAADAIRALLDVMATGKKIEK